MFSRFCAGGVLELLSPGFMKLGTGCCRVSFYFTWGTYTQDRGREGKGNELGAGRCSRLVGLLFWIGLRQVYIQVSFMKFLILFVHFLPPRGCGPYPLGSFALHIISQSPGGMYARNLRSSSAGMKFVEATFSAGSDSEDCWDSLHIWFHRMSHTIKDEGSLVATPEIYICTFSYLLYVYPTHQMAHQLPRTDPSFAGLLSEYTAIQREVGN